MAPGLSRAHEDAPSRIGPPGIVIALAVLLAIYLLSLTPYRIGNPASVFFTLVVYAAINNGLGHGLLVALCSWLFSAFYFVDAPPPAYWSPDGRVRLLLQGINLPFVAVLVGLLQGRAQRLAESQILARFTEASLQQNRDWLETTLQSIGDALIATDVDGNITFLNDTAQQLTGWTSDVAVGRPLEEVFSLIDSAGGGPVQTPVQQVLREGKAVSLSNHVFLHARDGREIPVDDSAAPIRDAAGSIIGAVVIFRDVSARKAAAKALERSETLFRATVEEAPISIFICEPDGSVLLTNRAWEKLYDVSREELHDYNVRNDPQLQELGYAPLLERIFAGEMLELPIVRYDPALIGKPGHPCWIRSMGYPVKDSAGNVTEVVLMVEDVSEREATLAALRQSEQRYQSLIRASAQIIWTAAADGSVEDMPMWRALTGQSRDEVRGWGWADALHPADREGALQAWRQAVAERSSYSVEYRMRRSDGVYRRFAVRGVPVLEADGTVREWVGSCTDITNARRDAALLAVQKRVLEKVARGDALDETLRELAEALQEQSQSLCSIMMLDERTGTLLPVAAPQLPPEYTATLESIGGVPVGEGFGSCGTAAFRREFVSVTDTRTDPLWVYGREVAELHGLRACWSQPIFDPTVRVVGTFAMYSNEPGEPDPDDRALIQAATDLAEIAVARAIIERDLRSALAREIQSSARLGAILRHVADGVIVADASGRIAFANDVARALHGVESLGDTLEEYGCLRPRYDADGNQLEFDDLPIMRAWRDGAEFISLDWQIERPDGERVWVQGTAVALPDADFTGPQGLAVKNNGTSSIPNVPAVSGAQRRYGAVVTLRDITTARRLVGELQHASQMKDEFLAVLSHELRTPLTPILGWLSVLRRARYDDSGVFEQALESIERNAELQRRLVNDLLDTSRIISGKLRIEPQRASLEDIARRAIHTVEGVAEERGVRLLATYAPGLPEVRFDPDRIQQVVMNMLTNAIKFSPDDATIELETALHENESGRRASLTVRDQGEGISAQFLPHVFDVFRQGDASYTRRHGGMGLGLAIARSIVELHGGGMTAHSDGPGTGATFSFWLPVE